MLGARRLQVHVGGLAGAGLRLGVKVHVRGVAGGVGSGTTMRGCLAGLLVQTLQQQEGERREGVMRGSMGGGTQATNCQHVAAQHNLLWSTSLALAGTE